MLEQQEIFDNFDQGFCCWTPERRLLQANAAFLRLMGFKTAEPFVEIPNADALSPAFAEMSDAIVQQVELLNTVRNFEISLSHANGIFCWVKADARRILNDDGTTNCYVAYITDVTSLKLREAELSRLTFYDILTGLPNRAFLISKIASALQAAKRYPDQYAIIRVDLDDLYNINQHYGRDFGDMLLRHTATTLLACCRDTDTVSRVGGDDFIILLRDPESGPRLVNIIKRIRSKLDVPFEIQNQRLDSIPAHFGVIFPLHDYNNPESVLRDADIAISRARAVRSRLGCKFFSKKMMAKVRDTLSLSVVLQKKRDLHGFHVLYQPIVRPVNSALHSFEALVRWSLEGRLVPPSTFIPVAEETGFIKDLGEFVLETACRQIRRWQDEQNASIAVHVNVSPRQLAEHDFHDTVYGILHRTGVRGSQLYFEVTESVFLGDFAPVRHNINLLRQQGIRFCLDDFGTGYSSLGYLQMLPIDCLKVDRSFISDLEKNAVSRILLKHIIALGVDMGYSLVVEGVERETQLSLLGSDLDRLLIQGYYFYKPLAQDAASALVEKTQAARQV